MRTRYYPAVTETDERGGFGIYFPDLPGCVSAGDTIEEVMTMAEEALAGYIEVGATHGDKIPGPSDLEAIPIDANADEVARVLVPVDLRRASSR